MENLDEKENLLKEIERLIAYGKEESFIDRNLLKYMDMDTLTSMRDSLSQKVNRLKDEDIEWLKQFKKDE